MVKDTKLKIGCHVSAAGGVFNAPKNAAELGCETFQIFTRPPMGGKAPVLTDDIVARFKEEMEKYFPSTPTTPSASGVHPSLAGGDAPRSSRKNRGASPPDKGECPAKRGEGVGGVFVVHCPYFVNFGSKEPRIYHGSISVVGEEMKRANMLGAKYVMTHLGSGKDLGKEKALAQAKQGLSDVLKKYQGETQFLLEIAAGAGETLGGTYEQLAELMEPLVKFKTFGGICFDTQHAFASGYDLRGEKSVAETFKQFDKIIGLKWLKMSHINDSKIELGGRKDRHDHIGDGKIGAKGFEAMLSYFKTLTPALSQRERGENIFPLIFETEHDKVEKDMDILKSLREGSGSAGKLRNKI